MWNMRTPKSKGTARIRRCLARRIAEARARGDEDIVLDVGQICREVNLDFAEAFAVCCDVLDSERFAKRHTLWYHHRTGAWGTKEAAYTFLLNAGTKAALYHWPSPSRFRRLRAFLWVVIAVVSLLAVGCLVLLVLS